MTTGCITVCINGRSTNQGGGGQNGGTCCRCYPGICKMRQLKISVTWRQEIRAKSRETSGFDSLLGSGPGEPVRRTCEGCKICTRRVRVSETRKEGGRKRGGGGERRRRGEEREERGRERRRAGAHSCSWLPPAGCVHSLDRYRLTHPRPPTPEARSCATLLGAVLPSDQGRQLALPLRRVVARSPRLERYKEGRG